MQDESYILSVECLGIAEPKDGILNIGGVEVQWPGGPSEVWIRRFAKDLTVAEIHMISYCGDGFHQEELDRKNREAEHHPLGPKEYWRNEMVGKYTYGPDSHPVTEEEFEDYWAEGEDDE